MNEYAPDLEQHHDGILHALKVVLVGDETPAKAPHQNAPHRRERLAIATHTVTLTAANPIQNLVNHEPNRCKLQLIVPDNPVVVCDSYGQACDQANQTAGLLNPNGGLLPVSAYAYELPTTDLLYVTAAAYPARVTVLNYSYAPD